MYNRNYEIAMGTLTSQENPLSNIKVMNVLPPERSTKYVQ